LTTEQYWKSLDALASSRDADRLLDAVELLRNNPSLPLLIACRRSPGHIHHLYTVFDERNPHAVGNRYLICFTSEKQAGKASQTSPGQKMKLTPPARILRIWRSVTHPADGDGRNNNSPCGKRKAVKWHRCPLERCWLI